MVEPEASPELHPAAFFALRTPLLPLEEFSSWGEGVRSPAALGDLPRLEQALAADRTVLRDRLRAQMARPEIREAIFVASPDLDDSLEVWLRDPEGERGQRVERALVRYFARMAGRPTPFGLFAGCSLGTIGNETRLEIAGRERYQRHTRLDMDYLSALTDALGKDATLRKSLIYRPNSSLYRAAGRLRYAEARLRDKVRSYHLVAVESADYLEATLEKARKGALAANLAQALVENGDGVTLPEAEEYIQELIDSQILVADLEPTVTGPEPVHGLVTELLRHGPAAAVASRLEQTRKTLEALDSAGMGSRIEVYKEAARVLEELPGKVELPRLFQVDMTKPAENASLGGAVLAEIVRGVEILHALSNSIADPLAKFREEFMSRYEGREVPLVEVLDEEVGIGFMRSGEPGAEASPLLDGLILPTAQSEGTPWGPRHAHLLRKLEEALRRGANEILLGEEDLKRLSYDTPPPLPDAFGVTATLAAASQAALAQGDFQVYLGGAYGPSGARLLGRFCHADSMLQQKVELHLRAEEALEPESVFAEVVHLPEGRLGNVLLRPVLREYEIPFLGRSGAPEERQIPVTDLLVSVVGGRVILRSARLDRLVIPRLTSAHNYTRRSLGLYRFLCSLQGQGSSYGAAWFWGPLDSARFLPRLRCGKLVFARARWRIDREEARAMGAARGAARFETVQKWRAENRMPRFVVLSDSDNLLPVDLDNALSIEALVDLIKEREVAVIEEMFPPPDQLCARGPEGRFVHELVIPFTRSKEGARPPAATRAAPPSGFDRRFPPGSRWLYAKLYTGTATADQVLHELVRPLTRGALEAGAADSWFFVRYGDPEWHIRLRLHGEPQRLQAEVLPALQAAAEPLLRGGLLWRVQLDTYEREVERYGGADGITLAERLFHADSEAVLEILEMLSGDEGADARWRLALRAIDTLLSDLGIDLDGRGALLGRMRAGMGKEFKVGKGLEIQLGDKFRKERKSLEALLDASSEGDHPLAAGFVPLRKRSERIVPLARELDELGNSRRLTLPSLDLAPSIVHMHVNRMLRSAQNAQELVLYDFLDRLYDSRLARAKKTAGTEKHGGGSNPSPGSTTDIDHPRKSS